MEGAMFLYFRLRAVTGTEQGWRRIPDGGGGAVESVLVWSGLVYCCPSNVCPVVKVWLISGGGWLISLVVVANLQ